MKTKTRQNAKSSDELQVVKNETERGNAGSKQARLVLVRCAELQTIDPKTKNSQSGQSVISRSRPALTPLHRLAVRLRHKNFSRVAPSLTMSQKYLHLAARYCSGRD